MSIIFIPKPLREKLGEEGTDALVQVLNENEKETRSSVIDLAERRFKKHLTEEIAGVRVEIADLRGGIQKSKADTIKWMFLFWIGQIGAVLGIILAVFK